MEFIYFIIIGGIAGWLAGVLFKGRGFGLFGNIVVGILGAIIGGWLAGELNFSLGAGILGSILIAMLGAIVLLFIVSLIRRG